MDQHVDCEEHGILHNMTDEDAIFIARLQKKERIISLTIMFLVVVIPLTVLFTLYALDIGREYLSFGFLLIFMLLHVYMMRGMFRR
jgi:hypothetical protein